MSNQTFNFKQLDKMPLTGLFIFMLTRNLRRSENISEDELEVVEYYYMARLGEIEKFIWITIIFTFISSSYLPIFFATALALLSIRIPSGGFHSSSTWGCFAWTLSGFLLTILILPSLSVNIFAILIIAAFSIIICYIASPIRSAEREAFIDKSKDKKLKYFATIMTILWFIVIFTLNNPFTTTIMWIIFLQNVQLLIEYYKRKLQTKGRDSCPTEY